MGTRPTTGQAHAGEGLSFGVVARLGLAGLLAGLLAFRAAAEVQDQLSLEPVMSWPVVPDPNVDPVVFAVAGALEAAGETRRHHPDDLDSVAAFYRPRTDKALWVGEDGVNAAAETVIKELQAADDWGLERTEFELPEPPPPGASDRERAGFEAALSLEVLRYARHARGGRVNPASVTRINDFDPPVRDPVVVLEEISVSTSADAYLRDLHPKHEQFLRLRQALLKARGRTSGTEAAADIEKRAGKPVRLSKDGPELEPGAQHADIAVLRERLAVAADTGSNPHYFDEPLERAVRKFQEDAGLVSTGWLDAETRKRLNAELQDAGKKERQAGRKARSGKRIQLILNNMERWRWLPYDMGKFYVWNNVPEFRARVIKGKETLFDEKIIVGLTDWATPSFFADMKYIIFHPSWGVPGGILMRELQPRLKKAQPQSIFDFFTGGGGGGASVLKAYNLTPYRNGKRVDPSSVNWGNVDIRNYSFVQPPGPKNPLGIVKFRFPNKHNVYMHDTIERELFAKSNRIFSHGCIRVQNPIKLAAVLLAEDKGWSEEKTRGRSRRGGSISLDEHIPVYVTYMTARVDDNGKLRTYGDVYGRDGRLAAKLGRSMRFDRKTRSSDIETSSTGSQSTRPAQTTAKKKSKKKKTVSSREYRAPDALGAAISGSYR